MAAGKAMADPRLPGGREVSPRGSVVMPRRVLTFASGATASAKMPGVIVYVKAASSRLHRQFIDACARLGVDAVERQCVGIDGRADAYECVGPLEKIERLLEHPAVADWHLIIGVRTYFTGAGAGEFTAASEKREKAAKRIDCQRAAQRTAALERNGPEGVSPNGPWKGSVRL